jgi:hypothetical protein
MSIAADDQPRPFPKKSYRAAAAMVFKKCFDFQAWDWFELELLLLIDLIC